MTDQSRVEAVARALAESTGWVWDGLREDQKGYWVECAQAAIDANDAWLKEQERRNTTVCPRCSVRCDVGELECRGCGQEIRWQPGYEPTFPEEPDR